MRTLIVAGIVIAFAVGAAFAIPTADTEAAGKKAKKEKKEKKATIKKGKKVVNPIKTHIVGG